ncbi:MAG: AbrB/MazE/SpoVT family DNA-binding domain-containing protein [Thermoplasmatales archaeon]
MPQLLDVSHVSKRGASLRMTIPKKAADAMDLKGGEIIGFYEEDGKIILRKME